MQNLQNLQDLILQKNFNLFKFLFISIIKIETH